MAITFTRFSLVRMGSLIGVLFLAKLYFHLVEEDGIGMFLLSLLPVIAIIWGMEIFAWSKRKDPEGV